MQRLPSILLIALLGAAALTLYATSGSLPARVASHFDFAGYANGFMPREGYLAFMSLVTFGAPALIVVLNVVLPRLAPRLVRVPARDYWLAPERREQTYASFTASGVILACLVTAFMIALHLLVEANARTPPRLDSGALWVAIAALVGCTLGMQFLRWRRFRHPG
jgi:uncharacterized membrane protein